MVDVIGVCPCGGEIASGEPVTVTADGRRWHPACRTKTDAAPVVAEDAPKRRGRPPKVRTPEPQ